PDGRRGFDLKGDGTPASDADLAALGITQAEIDASAPVAAVGSSYFRVPLKHFSTWDFNWGFGLPSDALPAPTGTDGSGADCPMSQEGGSTILCETQVLAEDIPLVGTGLQLHYSSERVAGHTESYTLTIPVTESTFPASAKGAVVEISVLGV